MLRRLSALLLLTAILALPAARASAGNIFDELKEVVKNKAYDPARTHCISGNIGFSMNGDYSRDLVLSLGYRYHFHSLAAVGVDVVGGFPFEAGIIDEIRKVNRDKLNGLQITTPRLLAHASFYFLPIYGKFMLFGRWVVHYDLYLKVGVGMAMLKGMVVDGQNKALVDTNAKFKFSPMWGVGFRLRLSKKVGIEIKIEDYIFSNVRATNKTESDIINNFIFSIGPTFIF